MYLWTHLLLYGSLGEKGRDLIQSYDNPPYTHRKIQKATRQHKNASKNVDYTMIADWLRTVIWSKDSHPTGVVKPVYGIPTFPQLCNQKDTQPSNSCVMKRTPIINPPHRDWGPTANQSGEAIKMWYTNIYSNIVLYQKYLGTSIKVGCATCNLYASSGPKAEGFTTNNQRGRGSELCRLCRGLDKARHIVPTALLARVQRFKGMIRTRL